MAEYSPAVERWRAMITLDEKRDVHLITGYVFTTEHNAEEAELLAKEAYEAGLKADEIYPGAKSGA